MGEAGRVLRDWKAAEWGSARPSPPRAGCRDAGMQGHRDAGMQDAAQPCTPSRMLLLHPLAAPQEQHQEGLAAPTQQLGQLNINGAAPAPGTFLPCIIATLKTTAWGHGCGSREELLKLLLRGHCSKGSHPSPLTLLAQGSTTGVGTRWDRCLQDKRPGGTDACRTDAPRSPRLQAACALLHTEQAPRREISTSIYPNQPDQLPGTKASSSNPLIRAGQMPPSPRGAGVQPQVWLSG